MSNGNFESPTTPPGLTAQEIYLVVEKFVGVHEDWTSGLRDFTATKLQKFLLYEVEVPANLVVTAGSKVSQLSGTLHNCPPELQRRILLALLDRLAKGKSGVTNQPLREELRPQVIKMVERLGDGGPPILPPVQADEIVRDALGSAQGLLDQQGAAEALDRVHTALMAYLRWVCDQQSISYGKDTSLMGLYALVRANHPALAPPAGWEDGVEKVVKVFAVAVEQLNTARNQASLAHPGALLPQPEARLLIDAAAALFRYLDAKIRTVA